MKKLLTLWAVGVAGLALAASPQDPRPNFVFIIGDDISAEDFGCYGNAGIRTPNIDRLAAQGLRFTNAYLTASSCSPSRASIITSRYPHNLETAALGPMQTSSTGRRWRPLTRAGTVSKRSQVAAPGVKIAGSIACGAGRKLSHFLCGLPPMTRIGFGMPTLLPV
jgi:hypothetical protein